jgi:hypothetical protein
MDVNMYIELESMDSNNFKIKSISFPNVVKGVLLKEDYVALERVMENAKKDLYDRNIALEINKHLWDMRGKPKCYFLTITFAYDVNGDDVEFKDYCYKGMV